MKAFPSLWVILIFALFSFGCIASNSRPAKYICRCEFSCSTDIGPVFYVQSIPLNLSGEGGEKCLIYAKNSCMQQGMNLSNWECAWEKSYDEFKRENEVEIGKISR
jgi:hypothetical protein